MNIFTKNVLFSCTILISAFVTGAYAKASFRFNVEVLEFWSNTEYNNLTLTFHNSTTDPSIDIDWQIFKQLDSLYFRTVFSFLTGFGKNGKQEMINHTIDACEDRIGHGNIVTMVVLSEMKKFGNLTSLECPIIPGHYYAKKIWLAEEYFPAYIPNTKLDLRFIVYTKNNGENLILSKTLFQSRVIPRDSK